MTLQQLRYIIEIERTGSITWAADSLFMSQPNLSRSIKELEEKLGFEIFRRSSQGMIPTREGGEMIARAKRIVAQADAIEEIGVRKRQNRQAFGVSAPRLGYVALAFRRFMMTFDLSRPVDIDFCETGTLHAIENLRESKHNLAIIRYDKKQEQDFIELFESAGFVHEEIFRAKTRALVSRRHPLAQNEIVTPEELSSFIELRYSDRYGPAPRGSDDHSDTSGQERRQAIIYSRSSLFDLLSGDSCAYTWVAPIPTEMLQRYNLVFLPCTDTGEESIDVVLWRGTYRLSQLDRDFISELHRIDKGLSG